MSRRINGVYQFDGTSEPLKIADDYQDLVRLRRTTGEIAGPDGKQYQESELLINPSERELREIASNNRLSATMVDIYLDSFLHEADQERFRQSQEIFAHYLAPAGQDRKYGQWALVENGQYHANIWSDQDGDGDRPRLTGYQNHDGQPLKDAEEVMYKIEGGYRASGELDNGAKELTLLWRTTAGAVNYFPVEAGTLDRLANGDYDFPRGKDKNVIEGLRKLQAIAPYYEHVPQTGITVYLSDPDQFSMRDVNRYQTLAPDHLLSPTQSHELVEQTQFQAMRLDVDVEHDDYHLAQKGLGKPVKEWSDKELAKIDFLADSALHQPFVGDSFEMEAQKEPTITKTVFQALHRDQEHAVAKSLSRGLANVFQTEEYDLGGQIKASVGNKLKELNHVADTLIEHQNRPLTRLNERQMEHVKTIRDLGLAYETVADPGFNAATPVGQDGHPRRVNKQEVQKFKQLVVVGADRFQAQQLARVRHIAQATMQPKKKER